jgi:hypothetical protein
MAAVRGDMGVQSAAGGWDALPGDIWQLILDRLVSVDTLYSVACAARDLACLSQVSTQTVCPCRASSPGSCRMLSTTSYLPVGVQEPPGSASTSVGVAGRGVPSAA